MFLVGRDGGKNRKPGKMIYACALLASYVLMILPQSFYGNSKMIAYAACYLLSMGLIIFALTRNSIILNKNKLFLLFVYVIILFLPVLYDFLGNISISVNDFLDVAVRIISFCLLFLLVPKGLKLCDLKIVFIGIALVALVASTYNMIINFDNFLKIGSIMNSYQLDIMSFFSNRNTFAMYLFAGIFSSLILLRIDKKRRLFWLFVIIVGIVNLFFTMSRGGLLSVLIILLPSILRFMRSHKIAGAFIIMTCIFLVLLIINDAYLQSMFSRLYIRSDTGASGRTGLWDTGMEIVGSNGIVTGVGYYTAIESSGISQFHSLFVDTLVEGGVLGLLFKVWMLFYAFYLSQKNAINISIRKIYKYGFFAILFLSTIESVNIFALGSTEMMFTILFVNIPVVLYENNVIAEKCNHTQENFDCNDWGKK